MARKRARARQLGLCIQCCKENPNEDRIVCAECNASAAERVRKRRRRDSEAAQLQGVIAAQERGGDRAAEHHLYEHAVQYYLGTLNMPVLTAVERLRVSEKLALALSLSENPSATPWFDHVLSDFAHPKDAAKSVGLLLQVARLLWSQCRGEAALAVTARAIKISEASKNARLYKLASLRMASLLQVFRRDEEAARIACGLGQVAGDDDASLRSHYFSVLGSMASDEGNAEKAYEAFELAIQLARNESDIFRYINVWNNYAAAAWMLGDITRAKACYEQALLIARQCRTGWLIPDLSLSYAHILAFMGQYYVAHEQLLEALCYPARAPTLDIQLAWVGIPIALHIGDEALLAKVARPGVVDLALQSGDSQLMGNVASAFAQLYVSQGRTPLARSLLHRALEMTPTNYCNYDLAIEIARYGAVTDSPQPRAFLEARVRRPHAEIFQASLALFDAFVAQRQGHSEQARVHARNARDRCDALQWYGRSELARAMVPDDDSVVRANPIHGKPFSLIQPALTTREQEIATLALRGFTNREIGAELAISAHTVEKHMSSIMNRLGIRSRHQLADRFATRQER